jgi:glutathione S-transferase
MGQVGVLSTTGPIVVFLVTQLTLVIGNKNYSSWSLRPWLAMKHFGLEFEEIRIPLYTPESGEVIRHYSPAGKVPVLLHRDVVVWDSLAICEYLAEQFPAEWWPKDVKAKAIARSICAEMHSGFQELRQHLPMNCRARFPAEVRRTGVQNDINRITTIWHNCRQAYHTKGPMLFGGFSIADAVYAPVILRFITYSVPLDTLCRDYANAVLALPALQEWLQGAEQESEVIPMFESR